MSSHWTAAEAESPRFPAEPSRGPRIRLIGRHDNGRDLRLVRDRLPVDSGGQLTCGLLAQVADPELHGQLPTTTPTRARAIVPHRLNARSRHESFHACLAGSFPNGAHEAPVRASVGRHAEVAV